VSLPRSDSLSADKLSAAGNFQRPRASSQASKAISGRCCRRWPRSTGKAAQDRLSILAIARSSTLPTRPARGRWCQRRSTSAGGRRRMAVGSPSRSLPPFFCVPPPCSSSYCCAVVPARQTSSSSLPRCRCSPPPPPPHRTVHSPAPHLRCALCMAHSLAGGNHCPHRRGG
jgi:hypothetical protein